MAITMGDVFMANEAGAEHGQELDWCNRCWNAIATSQDGLRPWIIGVAVVVYCFMLGTAA